MSSDWEISRSPVFASVIAFFFLLFQAESAVKRKQDMVTEGADSLSLAAVCCVLPKGRANKAATPCTRDAVLYWSSLLGQFFSGK